MSSSDIKTPSKVQQNSSDHNEENSTPQSQQGEVNDAAILAALRDYVPGTPEEK
jgi:hypothetical protein